MNIIITGASKGIGRATARELSQVKGNIILAISRDAEALRLLEREATYQNIIAFPFDLEELQSKKDLFFNQIKSNMEQVDVLINNAGFLGKCDFRESGCELSEKIFQVNFFAPANLIKLLVPLMLGNTPSHVVNIGSMSGYLGSSKYPGLAYYGASKAALASLTESLAVEFDGNKIAFNCLALGATQTEMLEEAFPDFKAPLKAHEMGKYIAEFALNGNRYFNGKVLPVALSNP